MLTILKQIHFYSEPEGNDCTSHVTVLDTIYVNLMHLSQRTVLINLFQTCKIFYVDNYETETDTKANIISNAGPW